jgi:hypothetical protein
VCLIFNKRGCKDKKKLNLSLSLTNSALRHKHLRGTGCIDSRIRDLGTSWRWVVSFTPRPLYPEVSGGGILEQCLYRHITFSQEVIVKLQL